MNAQNWILLAGVVIPLCGGIVAWLMHIERRMGRLMTREEHEYICKRSRDDLKEKLDQIISKIDKSDDAASKSQEHIAAAMNSMNEKLSAMASRVAVLNDRSDDDRRESAEKAGR